MKLFHELTPIEDFHLLRVYPSPEIVIDRLIGFSLCTSPRIHVKPIYQPLLIISKTKKHLRLEAWKWRIILMSHKPFIYKERL